ncbi:MAG TPA: MFS transporter [Acidimicrobiales bacterium]|nr:MFS transporter [Acidimicrobiales bacterium]
MSDEVAAKPPSIRQLAMPIYAPTFLFSVGQGAVIPIVALAAKDLGASVAVAGSIVALRGIGTLLFDIPAGAVVGRLGERKAMTLATTLLVVSLIGCIVSTSVPVFALCMFLMGCGWSVWLLARLAYVTDVMPPTLRGRALSTLGGIMRIGNFVGPFLGALLVTVHGVDATYAIHIVLVIAGWAVLVSVPEPDGPGLDAAEVAAHGPIRFRAIARDHRHVFLTAGIGAMSLSVLRASRQAVLPLWASAIGLDAAAVGIIFGISAAMDMTLFYPAGSASDRFGRKFVAVPCLTVLGAAFLLLPLTHSFLTIAAVGVLMGFGNGMGAGIVMTLGADFSPAIGRAEFLGVWRTVSDIGTAGGPLVAAAIAGVATLGAASVAVGALGIAGAAVVALRMPEPLRRDPQVASTQP